jgi:hypothetical protein
MMKINKTSVTAYIKSEMSEESKEDAMKMRRSAGKAMRPASISDTYGMGKPTRTNPIGGFMSMQCFSGSPDQRMSPTSKPGNAGKKRIV